MERERERERERALVVNDPNSMIREIARFSVILTLTKRYAYMIHKGDKIYKCNKIVYL